ncbi:MAG: SprT family zinc-dependent metalloprotease [Prolixibacteraceae bacterium]|jgi:predicted metal-dependent hydrolase
MDIKYSIIYSERKTIGIIVERDRSVIVQAPINTSEELIAREIAKRKRLLQKKIDHNQKYPFEKQMKEFVAGESLMYLGQNYKLHIVEDSIEGVIFDNKFFISTINQLQANKLFKQWYIKSAKEIIIPKAKLIANQIGVSYNNINILDLKYRWGSCTPKDNIHLNWRLIKAPINVIEYIIVHELTHLLESNHTPEFWNRVSAQLPNYEKAKHWLLENGHELETDF